MNIRPIKTKVDHAAALKEIDALMDVEPNLGTPQGDRLEMLITLVSAYEDKHWPADTMEPIAFLKAHMGNAGYVQSDLAGLIGRSRASEVLSRKRALTLDMIRVIAKAWHIPADLLIGEYSLHGHRSKVTAKGLHSASYASPAE